MARTKLKDTFTVDELADFFGLPTEGDIWDGAADYIAESGYQAEQAARADFERWGDEDEEFSEEDADKAREAGEQAAQLEVQRNWYNGVTGAAEELFGNIGLSLEPFPTTRKYGWYGSERRKLPAAFKIVPETSWEDAAEKIRVVIDGVGLVHVGYSLEEFLEQGLYTPRQAVFEHLYAARDYPEVYGTADAPSIYDRSWR